LGEAFERLLNEIVYNFEDFIEILWDKFHIAIKEFIDKHQYLFFTTQEVMDKILEELEKAENA
jgi:hypothetical protein